MTGALPAVTPARPLADPDVRRVVLVRLRTGLGDLMASVPALRALRRARPDLHVTVLGFPEVEGVVRRQAAYVDEFVPYPGREGIPERPPPAAAVRERFLTEVRARRFDLAVQMYGASPAANDATRELGARWVGGFVTPGATAVTAQDLATHLPYPFRAHEIDRHLRLMAFLGVPDADPAVADRALEFPLTGSDAEDLDAAWTAVGGGPGERPYAVVHPGATASSRRWPVERFAAVADGLAERGLRVVLTGVDAERGLVADLAARMRAPAVDLAGRTGLGGVAALVDGAAVVVSNDTGVVQLAVARRTPTVTVYLAGDARRWRGADPDRHRVAAVDVGCNPCGLLECPIDFRCAHRLGAEQVVALADAARATG